MHKKKSPTKIGRALILDNYSKVKTRIGAAITITGVKINMIAPTMNRIIPTIKVEIIVRSVGRNRPKMITTKIIQGASSVSTTMPRMI